MKYLTTDYFKSIERSVGSAVHSSVVSSLNDDNTRFFSVAFTQHCPVVPACGRCSLSRGRRPLVLEPRAVGAQTARSAETARGRAAAAGHFALVVRVNTWSVIFLELRHLETYQTGSSLGQTLACLSFKLASSAHPVLSHKSRERLWVCSPRVAGLAGRLCLGPLRVCTPALAPGPPLCVRPRACTHLPQSWGSVSAGQRACQRAGGCFT